MKSCKLLSVLLITVLLLALLSMAVSADEGVVINLVDGEDIYFSLISDQLHVRSGSGPDKLCSGTVTLVGSNVTIPRIYAARDVGIENVTITGSNITIEHGITASEGWGDDYWANGNIGPAIKNLTIAADNVTINGGINGGKGGDALHSPGIGGAVTNLTLSGSNITVNGGINGGKGGFSWGFSNACLPGNGGSVSDVTFSGSNIVINGGINPGQHGDGYNSTVAADGTVTGIQAVLQDLQAFRVYTGADSASASLADTLRETGDIAPLIADKNHIKLLRFPVHAKPEAQFIATGEDCGTLTGVTGDMVYSLDGTTWTPITGTSLDLTGLQAPGKISLYRPGDNTTYLDSAIQDITLSQAAKPENITPVGCTTTAQNDGKLTGVTAALEYRLSGAASWTAITADTVTGLVPGTYEIRVACNGPVLASPAATVTVDAHTCVAAGDWLSDETSHHKLCACGTKMEAAQHTGGTATCKDKAVCSICSQPYGSLNSESHAGGTATCKDKAVCSICSQPYGSLNSENHAGGTTVKNPGTATCGKDGYTGDTHCAGCGAKLQSGTVIPATGRHTYGDWAVTKESTTTVKGEEQRVCSVCSHPETRELPLAPEPDPTNPATGDRGILLPVLLLLLSAFSLTAVLSGKKRAL